MLASFSVRSPLTPGRFSLLPAGSIRAHGELRAKLAALRDHLLLRFDEICPESGKESAWFGGALPADSRAANALEAKLLTSALLPDAALRQDALALVSLVCQGQGEDGCLGPSGVSFAARGRMLRALMTAYSLTGDKDILRTVLRYFKYLRAELGRSPLSSEDALHMADTVETGIHFYNITGQKAILPVLELILSQAFPYTQFFHTFPYRVPVYRIITPDDLRQGIAAESDDGYYHQLLRTSNGANLCEGLRFCGFSGILTGSGKDISAPEAGLAHMNKSHGTAIGAISSSPLLAGTHPSRGISSKSVSELLASLEALMTCPNPFPLGDQWEAAFYNAALAAFSPDLSKVQPVQQVNQAEISRRSLDPLLSDEAGLFTLEDTDAAAAMLPVIPRFLRSQWMLSSDGGIAAIGYASCRVQAHIGESLLRLDVVGDYPYDGNVRIRLTLDRPGVFPVHLRIPSWAHGADAAINGETYSATGSEFLTLSREWRDGDVILLRLPMQTALLSGYHQAVSVARGPLRFVYAPAVNQSAEPDRTETLTMVGSGVALSSAFLPEPAPEYGKTALRARVYPLPDWKMQNGSLEQPPIDLPKADAAVAAEVLLRPYADTPVRIAVLPQC